MGNTKEKIIVNIMREFIVYTSRNKKSWKIIDELYYKYYDRCIDIEDNVNEIIKRYDINLENETIESTCYINKLVALIMLDENSGSIDNTMLIIKSTFNKSYKYAISNTIIKLSSFARKVNLKNSTDDIFSEFIALLITARLYEKKIDRGDEMYIKLLDALYELNDIYSHSNKSNFCYANCDKARKTVINELELIIRGKYFSNGYNVESLHYFLEEKRCFGIPGSDDRRLRISRTKDNVYCKIYCAFEYTDNIINKINSGVLLKDIEIEKETVKGFINAYLVVTGYDIKENVKIDKNDINLEELSTYVAVSLVQALYIEAYDNTYKFFFENYNDNINAKYKDLLNEDRDVKKTNLKLQDENERLKSEIEELKRKLDKSYKEIEKSKLNDKELFELRNYIFNNQENRVDIEEKSIDLEYLKDKKIICFGGNKAWISNMSKEFDDWIFISAETINFDATILKGADIVFVKANQISHSMYYKIIANIESSTEIKFINNNNINVIKKYVLTC